MTPAEVDALIENVANEMDQLFRQRHNHADVVCLLRSLVAAALAAMQARIAEQDAEIRTLRNAAVTAAEKAEAALRQAREFGYSTIQIADELRAALDVAIAREGK